MQYILPKSKSISGSTVIQQMGLDTSMGLQRLLQILTIKFDPEGKGIILTIDDLNEVVKQMVENKRDNFIVNGEKDQLFLKMCTKEEMEKIAAHQESLAQKTPS